MENVAPHAVKFDFVPTIKNFIPLSILSKKVSTTI